MGARKAAFYLPIHGGLGCFNGAAPVGARKDNEELKPGQLVFWLQRGRARGGAEGSRSATGCQAPFYRLQRGRARGGAEGFGGSNNFNIVGNRFNGAAPVGARKEDWRKCDSAGGLGFNGAAPVGARKAGNRRTRVVRQKCFNGAAPVGARKDHLPHQTFLPCGWLQRGRARGGAEGELLLKHLL